MKGTRKDSGRREVAGKGVSRQVSKSAKIDSVERVQSAAKLFRNGRSQAVRLPAHYAFKNIKEVYIRRDAQTGDVVLSKRPLNWESFHAALREGKAPSDFLNEKERKQSYEDRDPFEGWRE